MLDVFQRRSTQDIQLRRRSQQTLQSMMRIKNSARCHLLNLFTANLLANNTQCPFTTVSRS